MKVTHATHPRANPDLVFIFNALSLMKREIEWPTFYFSVISMA